MQTINLIPNQTLKYFCTMNRDKVNFPGDLLLSTNSSDRMIIKEVVREESDCSRKISIPQTDLSASYKPTCNDIICGRGRGSFLHEGNKAYLALLRRNIPTYLAAGKRKEKSIIISTLVSSLKTRGFRFLKQDEKNTRWYELSKQECYERTAHAIRDLIRKQKQAKRKSLRRRLSTDSESSVTSEKSEKNHDQQSMKVDQPITPLHWQTSFANDFANLPPLAVDTRSNKAKDNDLDSFDEQICQIPSEVMSPTDTLNTALNLDIFFEIDPEDFEKMLAQVDTDKEQRRVSMGSY